MKLLHLCLPATLLLLLSFVEVSACTCAGPRSLGAMGVGNFQPCGVYWSYDAVFIGRVEKLELVKNGDQISHLVAHLKVEKPIRGVDSSTVQVHTAAHTAACGYPFKEGESYFAYLRRGKDGKFSEWLCGATVPLSRADKDLDYLHAIENGEKGGRIFGYVTQLVQDSPVSERKYVGLADIPITLKNVRSADTSKPEFLGKEYRTKTGEDGFYIFYEIPAGIYLAEANTPANLPRNSARDTFQFPNYIVIDNERKRCGGIGFSVTTLGSISGKVVNSDGSLPRQKRISLLAADENGAIDARSGLSVWISPKDGSFTFDLVAPGRYTLAVNPRNCPDVHHGPAPEYGRSFYLGSDKPETAAFFDLKASEQKVLDVFKLQPTLKERYFSGIVVALDGTPVAGALVRLIDGDVNRCMALGGLADTKTDENGRFKLKGYNGFAYKLRGAIERKQNQSGFLQSELIVLPSSGADVGNIKLVLDREW